jgi:hypothetical protein
VFLGLDGDVLSTHAVGQIAPLIGIALNQSTVVHRLAHHRSMA